MQSLEQPREQTEKNEKDKKMEPMLF